MKLSTSERCYNEDYDNDLDKLYELFLKSGDTCSKLCFDEYIRTYKYIKTPIDKFIEEHHNDIEKCIKNDDRIIYNFKDVNSLYEEYFKYDSQMTFDTFSNFYQSYKNNIKTPLTNWFRKNAVKEVEIHPYIDEVYPEDYSDYSSEDLYPEDTFFDGLIQLMWDSHCDALSKYNNK